MGQIIPAALFADLMLALVGVVLAVIFPSIALVYIGIVTKSWRRPRSLLERAIPKLARLSYITGIGGVGLAVVIYYLGTYGF